MKVQNEKARGKQSKQKEQKMQKSKSKKGIALVSLVVTIIVLLILAGIPIAMMEGEKGIISQSQQAKKEVELAEAQKDLDLRLSEFVLEKETTDIEIGDFVDRLREQGKIKDAIENEDGSWYIETEDGYSSELKPDPENPGDIVAQVEGKTDELPAKITSFKLSSATNSITINLKVTRGKNTTYRYLYRTKEGKYELAHEGKELTYTIQGLTPKTMYYIKVEAVNNIDTVSEEGSIETKE